MELLRVLFISLLALSAPTLGLAKAKSSQVVPQFWAKRVPLIESKLNEALAAYTQNNIKLAKRSCDDAYFGVFEDIGANMEVAIRTSLSAKLAAELEEGFGLIRKSFIEKKSKGEIQQKIAQLGKNVALAAADLDKKAVTPP